MKRILIIAATLLMSLNAAAQMLADSTVQIVAYWQPGDKYSYNCERSEKEVNAQGDTTSRNYSTEIMEFEVVGMTDEAYQLKLTYRDAEYSDEFTQTIHDLTSKINGPMSVLFSTNRHGALMSIDNLDSLVEQYAKCVGPLSEFIAQSLPSEELEGFDLEGFSNQLLASLANPQTIQTGILDDIGRLFFFHGARLEPGQTYTMEEPLNFFIPGVEQTTAQTNLWAEKELTDSFSTVLRTYTSANIGEDTMKSAVSTQFDAAYDNWEMTDSLRQVVESATSEAMAQMQMKVKWEQYSSEEIHLETGWPLSLYQDKYVLVEAGDSRQEKIQSYYMEIILED